MCFNQPISFSLAALGFLMSLFVWKKMKMTRVAIGVFYFFLMEFLQGIQYFYIDQCDSMINKVLTILGLLHISFQPFFTHLINTDFSRKDTSLARWEVVRGLCVLSGIAQFMAWPLSFWDPRPPTPEAPSFDWLRGNKICTYRGVYHLAWSVPLHEPTYFTAGMSTHFFVMFAPFFVFGNWIIALQGLILLLSGPVLAAFITPNLHEQASVWCFFSIAQIFVMLAFIFTKQKMRRPKTKEE